MTQIFVKAVKRWWVSDPSTHGAALAYYTIFSLAPIFIILVVVLGNIFGPHAVEGKLHSVFFPATKFIIIGGLFVGCPLPDEIHDLFLVARCNLIQDWRINYFVISTQAEELEICGVGKKINSVFSGIFCYYCFLRNLAEYQIHERSKFL